jgi:hypothetical protein
VNASLLWHVSVPSFPISILATNARRAGEQHIPPVANSG